MPWTVSASASAPRDPKFKAIDKSALYAIAQAAVNVELFTIPLYMGTLYSIQGTHQIKAKDQSYFKGRLWPGGATTANPTTANEKAFNIIFSVFIQEMLHLQLAANIATAIGADPSFTSPMLQDANNGWTCYGPTNTIIPHIVDLRDLKAPNNSLVVNIAALTVPQVNLFLAIEEPDAVAREQHPQEQMEQIFSHCAVYQLERLVHREGPADVRHHRRALPVAIPSKGRGSGGSEAGSVNSIPRPGTTEHQTVGIHGKPTQLSLLQIVFKSGEISAFWKPNAARFPAEGLLVFVPRDQDLSADRPWMFFHQRQKSMSGRTGNDLQYPEVLESLKRFNQIAIQTIDVDLAAFDKTAKIDPGKVVNLRLGLRAIDLASGQCNRPIQIP